MNVLRKLIQALRPLLMRFTKWLEQYEEPAATRVQKPRWYQSEYHVPTWLVGLVSTALLIGILTWDMELTLYQFIPFCLFMILGMVLFSFYIRWDHPDLAKNDDSLVLLALVFFASLLWIKLIYALSTHIPWITPFVTPVAIASLLTALLLHPRLAMVLSFCVSILFGVVHHFSLELTLVSLIGCFIMVVVGSKARGAHHVAETGLLVGAAQAFMVIFLGLMHGWSLNQYWVNIPSAFISGLLAAFFSLGALPFLESFFSRTSNLRLLELADVNHPLLRRMSLEAPGTYHHSMIVANLAAESAQAINANALLCRVGAYFHDIGKIGKAEYFIENQGTFGNPHDEVAPSLSKLVIISHVKEGVSIGKTYKIEDQVLDFIPQHHGTSPIEYFYQKALKLEEGEEELDKEQISEESYRYPGPKPQTREAGIVMLADSIEAASRTLEEPSHQRFKDLVYQIVNKKFFDGQLDETPLTLKDLHAISERFVAVLISFNHARVPYPEDANALQKDKKERLTPP